MKWLSNTSIQNRLIRVILVTCAASLLLAFAGYFTYEYFNFRKTYLRQLENAAEIVSSNSTAALMFDDRETAYEILASLKADPHIIGAALYDQNGELFTAFPSELSIERFLGDPPYRGFHTRKKYFEGFEPVILDDKRIGLLYIRSDLKAIYEGFAFFILIAIVVFIVSVFFAFLISKKLQEGISKPIMALAETSKAVSDKREYSIRAKKYTNDELGLLTDAFNHMLAQIEIQNLKIVAFNENLESIIEERTKELKEATKEMEAFSYSISHDLRAPLRAVDGYASILEEQYSSVLDEEGKLLLQEVQNNAAKMGYLIDDLLAFSRLGRKGILKTQVNMGEMVKNVLNDMLESNPHKAIIKVDPLPIANADYSLIYQVWTNLLSNAIKYSGKKENPCIEIGSSTSSDETVYYVKDNGVGFQMEFAHKLFGVFERLHHPATFEGTGVGLAIVQRIIQKHGGKVWAEGKTGEGATFYFSLPR